jgi:hypothetical protein
MVAFWIVVFVSIVFIVWRGLVRSGRWFVDLSQDEITDDIRWTFASPFRFLSKLIFGNRKPKESK